VTLLQQLKWWDGLSSSLGLILMMELLV